MSRNPEIDPEVAAWLDGLANDQRRADCTVLLSMLEQATGAAPRMWGSMVGAGELHYRYASGREGDTFVLGMASRKSEIVLYLGGAVHDLSATLPGTKAGKGCLYLKRLADVDRAALRALLKRAAVHNRAANPAP